MLKFYRTHLESQLSASDYIFLQILINVLQSVKKINVNKHIIDIYERGKKEIIIKTFKFINQFVEKQLEVENNEEKTTEGLIKFLSKLSCYEKIRDALDDLDINVTDIEDIVLEDDDEIIQIDNSQDSEN